LCIELVWCPQLSGDQTRNKGPTLFRLQNFSHTARSLNKLKGKKEWIWNEGYNKAFKELKEKITSQLVLSLPKREGKFRVKTDALGHTIGGVLS